MELAIGPGLCPDIKLLATFLIKTGDLLQNVEN